jgi:hypothetical protein
MRHSVDPNLRIWVNLKISLEDIWCLRAMSLLARLSWYVKVSGISEDAIERTTNLKMKFMVTGKAPASWRDVTPLEWAWLTARANRFSMSSSEFGGLAINSHEAVSMKTPGAATISRMTNEVILEYL